jgi:hypothetical protein
MYNNYNYYKRTYSHRCVVCGNNFTAKRSDAKTCGETCRKRYSRRAEEVQGWTEDAATNIRQLLDHAKRYPDLAPTVHNTLTHLVSVIQSELEVKQ